MSTTKTIKFLLLLALFQFSFQQSSNFLPNIIKNVDEATVGYGNQAVLITHEGGSTLDDSNFNFEAIELENLDSDEWTVQWTDTEGEEYNLIDENGQIIAVGADNSTEDVTNQLADAAGIPASSVSGIIGTLAEDLVQKVDEKGGNVTLTGNEAYNEAVVPVTLAVLNAKFASTSVGSGLEEAGDKISEAATTVGSDVKDTAEDVGDKVSNAATDAWNSTKDVADTVADKASDIGNTIADKAEDVGNNIADAATDAWNNTKNAADTVADKASDVANTVADKAQDVGNSVADAATDFGENVSDAASDAWDKTKDVADTVADKTKDAADKVGDAISNTADKIKDGISRLFGN